MKREKRRWKRLSTRRMSTLMDNRLISNAGRKAVRGPPIQNKATKQLAARFGLSELEELPSSKEYEALAREALGGDTGEVASDPGRSGVNEWRVAWESA